MAVPTEFVRLSIATNQGESTGNTIWVNANQVESLQAMEGAQGKFTEIIFNSGRQVAVAEDPESIRPAGGR